MSGMPVTVTVIFVPGGPDSGVIETVGLGRLERSDVACTEPAMGRATMPSIKKIASRLKGVENRFPWLIRFGKDSSECPSVQFSNLGIRR